MKNPMHKAPRVMEPVVPESKQGANSTVGAAVLHGEGRRTYSAQEVHRARPETEECLHELPPPAVTGREWLVDKTASDPWRTEGQSTNSVAQKVHSVELRGVSVSSNQLYKEPDPDVPFISKSTFEQFKLSPELMKGIYKLNFRTPSKIQADSLRLILPNNDQYNNLIAQGHTGSGKTACFVLAMLNRVDDKIDATQALCIVPTRELARQVEEVVVQLGNFTKATSRLAIPMSDEEMQEARVSGGNQTPRRGDVKEHIVIGTPGKMGDWLKKRLLDPSNVKIFVVDEADKMVAAQGLGDQTLRIKKQLPNSTQVLLFSATYADNVQRLATKLAPGANTIVCEKDKISLGRVQQYFIDTGSSSGRYGFIEEIYDTLQLGQTVIFVETRKDCRALTEKLRDGGHTVSLLTGGEMGVDERDKVIDEFRAGTTRVLVATNVLSRGIDIPSVTAVINYDMPTTDRHGERVDAETYLHRIGRTGRFGRKGIAISLVYDDKSRRMVNDLSNTWKRNIKQVEDVEELESSINSLATGEDE